jgi:hypothetical protein
LKKKNNLIATQILEDVVNQSESDKVLIKDLINAMDAAGFGLAIMIFAFGIVIPLPPPFPSIISIPLILFSSQMVIGFSSPRLPQRFFSLSVKRSVLAMLVKKSSPYIRKVEKILRPRFQFMFYPAFERIIGAFILIFSLFIMLPIPLSNFIPGLGILIMSFGLLGKDGLFAIIGIIIGLIGVVVSIATIFLGVGIITNIKNFFI